MALLGTAVADLTAGIIEVVVVFARWQCLYRMSNYRSLWYSPLSRRKSHVKSQV